MRVPMKPSRHLTGGTMKIAQSTVDLVSTNKYYEENTVTIRSGVMTRESFLENLRNQEEEKTKL